MVFTGKHQQSTEVSFPQSEYFGNLCVTIIFLQIIRRLSKESCATLLLSTRLPLILENND